VEWKVNCTRTNLECRYELRQCDEKEIKIEKKLELLIEHQGKKRDYVVFLILDDVGWKSRLQFIWKDVKEFSA